METVFILNLKPVEHDTNYIASIQMTKKETHSSNIKFNEEYCVANISLPIRKSNEQCVFVLYICVAVANAADGKVESKTYLYGGKTKWE